MRDSINQLILKFDEMPTVMRFLVLVGLAPPLIVVGMAIETGLSFSIFMLGGVMAPVFIASFLMIVKNKYSRVLYIVGSILIVVSPYLAPSLRQYSTYSSDSHIELVF